jgi:RNA polymerase sigma-70 factor (ECF subfamily)
MLFRQVVEEALQVCPLTCNSMACLVAEFIISSMGEERTTIAVEQYLKELAGASGDTPAEPIIRELLARSVDRLHMLCGSMLHHSYPRLTQPPLNLQTEEMIGAVVERMMKAMRKVHPTTVRQFFALANQHIRWELNDMARRLDDRTRAEKLHESAIAAPTSGDSNGQTTSSVSPNTARIMEAIESLPEEERETFSLVRVQGMTHSDAAAVLGVSVKTVQRRLNRTLPLLVQKLRDLQPYAAPPA